MPDAAMPPITVRPLGEADLPVVVGMVRALAALHGDAARTDPAALARDALGPTPVVRVLVAERADALAGYAAFFPLVWLQYATRALDMHHLFVAEDHRRQGVATALLDAGTRLARDLGCTRILVGTAPDNAVAQGFYQSHGFERRPDAGVRFMLGLG